MSPKVTMNRQATAARTSVLALAAITRSNRCVQPQDGNALEKVENDVQHDEAGCWCGEPVVRQCREVPSKGRRHGRAVHSPDQLGDESRPKH